MRKTIVITISGLMILLIGFGFTSTEPVYRFKVPMDLYDPVSDSFIHTDNADCMQTRIGDHIGVFCSFKEMR